MRNDVKVISFAAILAIVCALLLTAADQIFRPFREANEKAEEVRNFLVALEIPVEEGANAQTLVEVFEQNIERREWGDLTVYVYSEGGVPVAYAIPFSGPGLWGPVDGVVALEADLLTIRGVRFYKQEETPGLGGEIGAEWFQDQFRGKSIVSNSGQPGFTITKPKQAGNSNEVDGITGATMTSDRVGTILDSLSKQVFEERSKHVQQ